MGAHKENENGKKDRPNADKEVAANGKRMEIGESSSPRDSVEENGPDPYLLPGASRSEYYQIVDLLDGNRIRYIVFSDNSTMAAVLDTGYQSYHGLSEIKVYVRSMNKKRRRAL